MAEPEAPSEPETSMSEQTDDEIARQIQETMANYLERLQGNMSPRGTSYAAESAAAARDFVQKMSQARDPQDMGRIQAEFLQMQLDSFSARAKELSDAAAAARNMVAGVTSLLHWRKVLDEMERNAPTYKLISEEDDGRKRSWSAAPQSGGADD